MAYNKITINGSTILDLTADTVTAETLQEGVTAHNAAGTVITGSATSGGDLVPPDPIEATTAEGNSQIVASSMLATFGSSNSYTATQSTITVPYAGTYLCRWVGYNGSSRRSGRCALYKNGTVISGTTYTMSGISVNTYSTTVTCAAGDVLTVYVYGTSSTYAAAGLLTLSIGWDIGTGADSENYSG